MDQPHQAVEKCLLEHDKLCTWEGIVDTVGGMLACASQLSIKKKDGYGELGSYLHRIFNGQQSL